MAKGNFTFKRDSKAFILDYTYLKPGDIVLMSGYKIHSKIIKKVTNSNFSHAIITLESNSLFDAQKDGIFTLNPQRLLVKSENDLKVLRLNIPLSKKEEELLIRFLRDKVGSTYSVKEAINVIKEKKNAKKELQFCSRLIAQAYQSIGHDIVDNADFCSPEDINLSNKLIEVNNIVREATISEIIFCKTIDVVHINKKSTYIWLNNVVSFAYKKYKYKIQQQNDVTNFLLSYPDADKQVCKFIKNSKFLDTYKIEISENPYYYNLELFIQKFNNNHNQILNYIIVTLKDMKPTEERFIRNLEFCNKYYLMNGQLEYFRLHINLYINIFSKINIAKYKIFEDACKHISKNIEIDKNEINNTINEIKMKISHLNNIIYLFTVK